MNIEYEIELTRGKWAKFDAEDYDAIYSYQWRWNKSRMESGYAIACVSLGRVGAKWGVRRERKSVTMHGLISKLMGFVGEPDHINGDGLDNRRHNLRLATRTQQCQNRKAVTGSSKYKGVRLLGGKWQVRIKASGVSICLGSFLEECDAAQAYNFAALEHFGEFARFNEVAA